MVRASVYGLFLVLEPSSQHRGVSIRFPMLSPRLIFIPKAILLSGYVIVLLCGVRGPIEEALKAATLHHLQFILHLAALSAQNMAE